MNLHHWTELFVVGNHITLYQTGAQVSYTRMVDL